MFIQIITTAGSIIVLNTATIMAIAFNADRGNAFVYLTAENTCYVVSEATANAITTKLNTIQI